MFSYRIIINRIKKVDLKKAGSLILKTRPSNNKIFWDEKNTLFI